MQSFHTDIFPKINLLFFFWSVGTYFSCSEIGILIALSYYVERAFSEGARWNQLACIQYERNIQAYVSGVSCQATVSANNKVF